MELIIPIACGFCAGCLLMSWYLFKRARKEYELTIQCARRALEGMERGHLLRVIEDEPLLKEETKE